MALDQLSPTKHSPAKRWVTVLAVKPTDKIVVSPAAGTIVKIFNTNHAFCPWKPKKARRSSSIPGIHT
ncbi:hypothetical protein ACNKHN_03450 [Shigella flexneri]